MFNRKLKDKIAVLEATLRACEAHNSNLRKFFNEVNAAKLAAEDELVVVSAERNALKEELENLGCDYATLMRGRDELAQWKKSALPLLPSQEAGELLGLTAGDDIAPAIVPGIKKLKTELQICRQIKAAFRETGLAEAVMIDSLKREVKKLKRGGFIKRFFKHLFCDPVVW